MNSYAWENHSSTSYFASSEFPDAWMRFAATVWLAFGVCAKSLRILPGFATFGNVTPTSRRTVGTASTPSRHSAMTGPVYMKLAVTSKTDFPNRSSRSTQYFFAKSASICTIFGVHDLQPSLFKPAG